MVISGRLRHGDELHAQCLGLLREVVERTLAVAFLEVVLPPVGVILATGKHGVDQPSQLVGGCCTTR